MVTAEVSRQSKIAAMGLVYERADQRQCFRKR
jgi:hypothetical protein